MGTRLYTTITQQKQQQRIPELLNTVFYDCVDSSEPTLSFCFGIQCVASKTPLVKNRIPTERPQTTAKNKNTENVMAINIRKYDTITSKAYTTKSTTLNVFFPGMDLRNFLRRKSFNAGNNKAMKNDPITAKAYSTFVSNTAPSNIKTGHSVSGFPNTVKPRWDTLASTFFC
jgi:hypothetical protein